MPTILAAVGFLLIVQMTMFEPPESLSQVHDPVADWLSLRAVEMLLNVALFVPLGMAVGWVGRARWLWAVVAVSITIEVLQLGLPDRRTELIDVVTNSAGGVLGYLLTRRLRDRSDRRPRTPDR